MNPVNEVKNAVNDAMMPLNKPPTPKADEATTLPTTSTNDAAAGLDKS